MSTLVGKVFTVSLLPLRGFLRAPPAPANRFGAGVLAEPPSVSCACNCLAKFSSCFNCSLMYALCFSIFSPGRLFSITFLILIISPSRSPRERIVESVISGRRVSSILSRSNADAYRVQSSMSHPAERKKSNQSMRGPFDFCI